LYLTLSTPTAGSSTDNQTHILIAADLDHTHALDAAVLTQVHNLTVADIAHAHATGSVILQAEGYLDSQ